MTRFAAGSTRPDGAPWLFNDGGLDVAPTLQLPSPSRDCARLQTPATSSSRAGSSRSRSTAAPSPTFLPAHAHADGLSFQLWLDGRPIVLDPGMPTYEPGAERDFLRSTGAHSTVAVGGSQFETGVRSERGRCPRSSSSPRTATS